MKKALSAIGIAALTAAMLTACGRRNDVTEQVTTSETASSTAVTTTTVSSNEVILSETKLETGDIDGDGFVEDVITDAGDLAQDVVTGAQDIVEDVLPGDSNNNGR